MNRITALQRDGFVAYLKFDTAFEDKAHLFAGMRDQRRLARFCRQFEQESFQPLLADAGSELAPGIICAGRT
jgi:hypothetical protein